MKSLRLSLGLVAIFVGATQFSMIAEAASAVRMKADCRARAAKVLRERMPNISTKYEGRRVDGTHAVNGTVRARGRYETFQCSFNRSGRRIVRFVVN